MKKENLYYDVYPRIVRTFETIQVTVRPRFAHCSFQDGESYRTCLIPMDGLENAMQITPDPYQYIQPHHGDLVIPCIFHNEQEYLLAIRDASDEPVVEFRLYALERDLFVRWPFKGDTHMHSYHSDGKESPAYVAAACRKIGMDFITITDHHRYAPSLEAMRAFADAPIDLHIYPGEEVHPPQNQVHIVNFGGGFSINDLFESETYRSEVSELAASMTDLPAEIDRYPYASCVWVFNKIRQAGGLGIFCHPYWISNKRYDVPLALTDLIFERQPYDALELIGGYHLHEAESNILQVARYHELRSQGKRIPIVGASDSHGCETGSLFGWYYTIVFSPSLELSDLIESIKDGYSVAVESLPNELVRAFGPFRMVQYAQFLLREILPSHDTLCMEEGDWMLAFSAGDPQASALLSGNQGRSARLYEHIWSQPTKG